MASAPPSQYPNDERGPFRADQLKSGDRYELYHGHAVHCAPAGGAGATRTGLAAHVVGSDPGVRGMAVDPGYAPAPNVLFAPDVAVGVPDTTGWIEGVPPLAIEYASVGQDENRLKEKVAYFLKHGTKFIWVVRLLGPRRVEVYEPGAPVRLVRDGEQLEAPGILTNPVPFEALFDEDAAHEAAFRNLLGRHGYKSLAEVRAEGIAEGKAEGIAEGKAEGELTIVRLVLEQRFGALPDDVLARLGAMSEADKKRVVLAVQGASSLDDVLGAASN